MGPESEGGWPVDPSPEFLAVRFRDFHQRLRRVEASLDMNPPREFERRLSALEKESADFDPKVTALRLSNIERTVANIQKAVYGLMFVIVAASVTFAFTVFALLGRHSVSHAFGSLHGFLVSAVVGGVTGAGFLFRFLMRL